MVRIFNDRDETTVDSLTRHRQKKHSMFSHYTAVHLTVSVCIVYAYISLAGAT